MEQEKLNASMFHHIGRCDDELDGDRNVGIFHHIHRRLFDCVGSHDLGDAQVTKNKDYGFKWGPMDRGDQYILNESSYTCLFNDPNSFGELDRWMDIGANFGSFAIRISPLVKRVIAVEPEPSNCEKLRTNVSLNMIQNITVIEAAVIGWDSEPVNLALGHTFNYTHRVGRVRGRDNITVQGFNINEMVAFHAINKIKMDCEGSEYEILRGLDATNIQEIILEWHFTLIPDSNWVKMREAVDRLKEQGFQILRAPEGPVTKRWTAIIWARR